MLACFRCRAEIPGDSQFCPICGARTADVDGADTQRDEQRSLEEAPTDLAEPVARRTMVMAPAGRVQGPPAPQYLGPPGPAAPTGWPPPAGTTPMPHAAAPWAPPQGGLPGAIPITPSPARILLGALLVVIALVLGIGLMPALGDDVTVPGRIASMLVAAIGVLFIVAGLRSRASAEVVCRVCRRPVVAWKSAFGLDCPLGPHQARVSWGMLALTVAFWTGAAVCTVAAMVLFL